MREEITIVSGLPRSGTSMMMKMLAAGGIPPLADSARGADEDNPGGYFEFEPVTRLEQDSSWIDRAKGRALKVISELLRHLPADRRYRVVFMVRKIEEVLASQRKMLDRRRTTAPDGPDDERMATVLLRHLDETVRWLERQPNFEVLFVSYNEIFRKTGEHVDRIADFLGGELDRAAMSAVVDPTLYRRRG